MYRILTLLIITTTVAIFFAARAISGDAALIAASLFASVAFACSSSFQERATPKKIIAASTISAFATMMLLGCPLAVLMVLNELEWQLTWNVEDLFTRIFAFRAVAIVMTLIAFTVICGGLAAFGGMILGVGATHVIYSWIRGRKIHPDEST